VQNTILVIEDEIQLSDALCAILRHKKFNVIIAYNGNEGIKALQENGIDLVLCDINLPDIDGYEILKAVRSNKVLYQMPFIFLTAFAAEDNIRKGRNHGADDYITKPFDSKKLIETINARLRLSESRKELMREQLNKNWENIINKDFKQEFMTPLNSLINATFLIESTPDQINVSDFKEAINAIYVSSFRIFRNTRNLMFFSLLTNNELTNSEKRIYGNYIYFSDIVSQIVEYYNNGLIQGWNTIKSTIDFVPLKRFDSDHISIIITELIDNGVKYDSKKLPPKVSLFATGNGCFNLSITNNINEDTKFDFDQIKPFHKFHDDKSHNGLGLGLYISKELCLQSNLIFRAEIKNEEISFLISRDVVKDVDL
jgi:two-component system, sensor histidine kinase and response regulator